MNNSELLNKLKSLPRHGQTPTPDPNASSAWDAFSKAIDSAAESLEDFADVSGATQFGINAITTTVGLLADKFMNVAKKTTFLENRNAALNKTFGLSSTQAARLGDRLDNLSDTLGIGGDRARAYTKNLAGIQNGFLSVDKPLSNFQKKLLQGQKYMVDQLQVTEKAAAGYELYSATIAASGMEQLAIQNEIANSIEKATGITGVQKDLTETIGNMASNLQMQYGRIPGSLELAVLKSRALGMSMEDLNKAGSNLLDIEGSIGQELEYQLLTGERLVNNQGESLTNLYRQATLEGNANKQADIMNQIIADQGENLENNMFARQQMAKMLGMEEAQLAKSIQKQRIITKLGAEELMSMSGDKFDTEIQQLQEKYKDDPDKKKMIDDLMAASDTRTTQERMADTLDQILSKGIFQMTEGQADKIVESTRKGLESAFKTVVGGVSGAVSGPGMARTVGGLGLTSEVIGQASTLVTELSNLIPFVGKAVAKITAFLDEASAFKDIAKAGAGGFVFNATPSGTENQDFLMRSNGQVVPFTSKDDIVGAKAGGPLAQALSNGVGGGTSKQDLMMLASMIVNGIQGVKLEVAAPLGSGTSMNNGRFA
jgi:uncharacterized protein YihD (DUF1040 family)